MLYRLCEQILEYMVGGCPSSQCKTPPDPLSHSGLFLKNVFTLGLPSSCQASRVRLFLLLFSSLYVCVQSRLTSCRVLSVLWLEEQFVFRVNRVNCPRGWRLGDIFFFLVERGNAEYHCLGCIHVQLGFFYKISLVTCDQKPSSLFAEVPGFKPPPIQG